MTKLSFTVDDVEKFLSADLTTLTKPSLRMQYKEILGNSGLNDAPERAIQQGNSFKFTGSQSLNPNILRELTEQLGVTAKVIMDRPKPGRN